MEFTNHPSFQLAYYIQTAAQLEDEQKPGIDEDIDFNELTKAFPSEGLQISHFVFASLMVVVCHLKSPLDGRKCLHPN